MSSNSPPNPFGESQGSQFNPYQSPQAFEPKAFESRLSGAALVQSVKWKVMPPAIVLCVIGGLGMVASILTIVFALVTPPAPPVPNETEFMRSFREGQSGPGAAAIQSIFIFVNLTIIVGGIQMMRIKIRPMGFVAAILAMVNCANLCCVLGLPAGIWAIAILCQSDVARAFEENY